MSEQIFILSDPNESEENKEQLCAWQQFMKNDHYIPRKGRHAQQLEESLKATKAHNDPTASIEYINDISHTYTALSVCKSIIYFATNLKYHRLYTLWVK